MSVRQFLIIEKPFLTQHLPKDIEGHLENKIKIGMTHFPQLLCIESEYHPKVRPVGQTEQLQHLFRQLRSPFKGSISKFYKNRLKIFFYFRLKIWTFFLSEPEVKIHRFVVSLDNT